MDTSRFLVCGLLNFNFQASASVLSLTVANANPTYRLSLSLSSPCQSYSNAFVIPLGGPLKLNFNHLILLLHGCVALELDNMRWQ